jgi:hypothetical protein
MFVVEDFTSEVRPTPFFGLRVDAAPNMPY